MSARLDDQYFEWLYSTVAATKNRNPARSFWILLRQMHSTEFVWFVPNDDNRVEDGLELRDEFVTELGLVPDPEWMGLGCSVLEMLVALARRCGFQRSETTDEWFWRLVEHIGLRSYNDRKLANGSLLSEVDETINQLIFRTYGPAGEGGLFPLKRPHRDQTKVELWYQMQAYMIETYPLV